MLLLASPSTVHKYIVSCGGRKTRTCCSNCSMVTWQIECTLNALTECMPLFLVLQRIKFDCFLSEQRGVLQSGLHGLRHGGAAHAYACTQLAAPHTMQQAPSMYTHLVMPAPVSLHTFNRVHGSVHSVHYN
jgi:hypothetical protein